MALSLHLKPAPLDAAPTALQLADGRVLRFPYLEVISADSRYQIPILKLRKGGDEAIAALRMHPLFGPNGPRRQEMLFIGDLLRQGGGMNEMAEAEQASRERVVAMRTSSRAGKLTRDAWELQL